MKADKLGKKANVLSDVSQWVLRLHFGKCIPPLLFSTQLTCRQPKPAQTGLVNTKTTNQNASDTKILYCFLQISAYICRYLFVEIIEDAPF